jgi:hypothetical protein
MVLDRSNTGIVGLNPVWVRDVCPRFSVLLYCVGRCFAMGRAHVRGVLLKCLQGFVLIVSGVNSGPVQARGFHPWNLQQPNSVSLVQCTFSNWFIGFLEVENNHVCVYVCVYEDHLQSSWTHLITPSQNLVEVRWRSVPPLASDALLTTLHPFLENVL